MPQDHAGLLALLSDSAVYAGLGSLPYPTPADLRAKIEAPGRRVLVGTVDQEPIALAVLCPDTGRKAHSAAFELAVRRDYQGRGVGRGMLTHLLDLADNWLRLTRVQCDVMASNAPAIALYESLGFEREGLARGAILTDGRFEDQILMARLLTAPPAAGLENSDS